MENKIEDQYDQHIAYLNKNPEDIYQEWSSGRGLFKMVGEGTARGCLTMIRCGIFPHFAYIKNKRNIEITNQIKNDSRIPSRIEDVKLEHLPVFAEWQRKIDELNK